MKSVLANIELVVGLFMMGFLLPLLAPRDPRLSSRVLAFFLVALGLAMLIDGFRRVLRYENDDDGSKKP
jgi:small neutral amino acid transporter SnatA (MarC family)